MKIEKFKAILEEVEPVKVSKNQKRYRYILAKIPGYTDQFTGEKKGEDQYFRIFISGNYVDKFLFPAPGSLMMLSVNLKGERKLDNENRYYYPISMMLQEIETIAQP